MWRRLLLQSTRLGRFPRLEAMPASSQRLFPQSSLSSFHLHLTESYQRFTTNSSSSPGDQNASDKATTLFNDAMQYLDHEIKRPKALRKLKQAAELGHVPAQGALGQILLEQALADDKVDPSQVLRIEKLVPGFDSLGRPTGGRRDANETKLEILRIRNSNKGKQMQDNRAKGLEWLLSAAAQGHTDSMVVLGNAYMQNEQHRQALTRMGVDRKDALLFYQTAAEGNPPHPDALYNLGTIYYREGDGQKALQMMTKAAEECKDRSALFWIGKFYMEGDAVIDPNFEGDVEKGWDCISEAAALGLAEAQVYAALFLAQDPDMYPVAKQYLERAVNQEDAAALFLCADLHMQDEGSFYGNAGRDYAKALRLYERAGVQGHGEAFCCAGAMHYNGLGTPKNHFEAYRAYEQAAKLGCLDAYKNIASMYMKGEGPLECNPEIAREILEAVKQIEDGANHSN